MSSDADIRAALAAKMETLQISSAALAPIHDAFVQQVYLAGLWDRMDESTEKGMSGRYGGTWLRSWWMAGRIMLTFESDCGQVTWLGPSDWRESIAFRRESDPAFDVTRYGYIGLHSLDCAPEIAEGMMREVIALWPASVAEQRAVWRDDAGVTLDVLAGREQS